MGRLILMEIRQVIDCSSYWYSPPVPPLFSWCLFLGIFFVRQKLRKRQKNFNTKSRLDQAIAVSTVLLRRKCTVENSSCGVKNSSWGVKKQLIWNLYYRTKNNSEVYKSSIMLNSIKAFESVYFVRKLYLAILDHLWLLLWIFQAFLESRTTGHLGVFSKIF